ncbi:MAG: TIGR04076 family protein [Candidatus Methanomethylophilaceae archaeon]|nr:TIGR04076 family protein [Candidatus Methanomethylophilaceae archaeon]
MRRCRITVMRIACYRDLMERYENPIPHACDMKEGQVFITDGWKKPEGMCDSAWGTLSPFVMTLAHGGEDIYDGWMKDKRSAMISCNDGFRPVSFYIEAMDE